MLKHGYVVDEHGYIQLGCVKHKLMYDAYVDTLVPSGEPFVHDECPDCADEAYYGCALDKIGYCEEHGRNFGPNKPCCDESWRKHAK